MSGGDPYVYPDKPSILRNKLGIRNAAELERVERIYVAQRIEEGVPEGEFDLRHIRAIHRHLFQDIYDWAGAIRTVELSKGGHHFQPVAYIAVGIANIHARLVQQGFLEGLNSAELAREAAQIIGDLNYAHPFREGNGRTQLQYLKL